MNFAATLDPSGKLPAPQTRRGKSLAFYSRSPKAVALSRIKFLPIQQAGRTLLAFYVQMGRGKKHRSWFTDGEAADLLPRSGGGSYSRHHTRRWRRVLEAVGLIRCIVVEPGAPLPNREDPDKDTGHDNHAGRIVVEVNMGALLGVEPCWRNPVRGSWQDDRDAREAADELRAELEAADALADAEREQLAALEASPVDDARHESPEPSPAAASRRDTADPSPLEDARRDEAPSAPAGQEIDPAEGRNEAVEALGEGITHAHGGVIIDAHPSVNSGSPSENKTFDPGSADAPGAPPAPETHANAGGSRAAVVTAAAPPRPTPSGSPGLPETRATNEKSTSRTIRVGEAPRIPRGLADKLRELGMPVAYGSVEGEGPAVSSPTTLAPPVRAPSYRGQVELLGGADLAPQGRNGERLGRGWNGGGRGGYSP